MERDPQREPGAFRLLTSAWRQLPDFLIIGAQRSGSSSLYKYLHLHPKIRWARMKEVHFFDRAYQRGEDWYRAQFPMAFGARSWITGDASPYYMVHPQVPARAAHMLPDARLIAILRNPVDRAYSQYQHVVRRGNTDLSFEDALAMEQEVAEGEMERLVADPGYRSRLHEWHSYVGRGHYAEHLERWLQHYPRDRLHVVIAEHMFDDPNGILAGVARFLGLAPHSIANPEELVVRGTYASPMPDPTRARLEEHFLPHNQRLEALLGFEVGWDH